MSDKKLKKVRNAKWAARKALKRIFEAEQRYLVARGWKRKKDGWIQHRGAELTFHQDSVKRQLNIDYELASKTLLDLYPSK